MQLDTNQAIKEPVCATPTYCTVEQVIAEAVVAGDDACNRGDIVCAENSYCNAVSLAATHYGGKGISLAYFMTILATFYESHNLAYNAFVTKQGIRELMADYTRA